MAIQVTYNSSSFPTPETSSPPSSSLGVILENSPGVPISTSNPLAVESDQGRIDVIPVVQASAYSLGNSIGGLISLPLPRTSSGILQDIAIQFIGGGTPTLYVYVFDVNPTGSTFTDKSTFSIAVADEAKRINKVPYALTPAVYTGDNVSAAYSSGITLPFSSTGTLYFALCVGGSFTPASTTDLRISIGYFQ